MVVLQIEVADFALPNLKGQPPVAADRNAPYAGAITLQLMNSPARRPLQGLDVRRRNQRGQNPPYALHEVAAHLAAVVVSNEAQQAPMPDIPNDHYIRAYGKTVHLSSDPGL